MDDFLFYLGFSTLIAHELDAVIQREWRLLYVLRGLPESTAAQVFILGHVPLLTVLLLLVTHGDPSIRVPSRAVFDGFLIVHALLHWRLRTHPLYTFHSLGSRALIGGAAVVGAAHLFFALGQLRP